MEQATTIDSVHELLTARRKSGTIGFVPTMGALHDGHLALIRLAKSKCATVVVSIFVNPTQFNDPADFDKYPRDVEHDAALCADAGADILFVPSVEEMYPPASTTTVAVSGHLTETLEGAYRPGHFQGVTTVVSLLFHIVQSDVAYFGEKDWQQLAIIRKMVHDQRFPLTIVGCPTVREADGLAMSSRNVRLSAEDRIRARVVPYLIDTAQDLLDSCTPETQTDQTAVLQHWLLTLLQSKEPTAIADYIAIVHPETLEPLEIVTDRALVAVAINIGGVRLIDNRIIYRR